ncbi:hypothetical protein pipiens_011915 [Culex pipiens pipiens]|uniref:Chitin-binding type-2 domain-containing protein n=1 Tax=Culex pipiens pipiens TaxID=38569 RepID=A0ABD1D520_CULPP
MSSLLNTVLILATFITFSNAQCTTGSRFACANCSTVSVCSYGGIQVDAFRCDSVNASLPFCSGNTGVCKSAPEGSCIQPSELCPRASDTFPNPSNCLQYIRCDAQKQAQTIRCSPSSYVYDHSTRSCKLRQTSNDCFQVNCALASNLNRWTSYRPAPKLAFYCSIAVGPMTFECSTGENQVFNVVSRSCVFGCPSEGRFPVPDDGTKYYQCARGVYGVLVAQKVSCSAGLVFDPSLANCTVAASTTTEPATTLVTAGSTTAVDTTELTTSPAETTTSSTATETSTSN